MDLWPEQVYILQVLYGFVAKTSLYTPTVYIDLWPEKFIKSKMYCFNFVSNIKLKFTTISNSIYYAYFYC